MNESLNIPLHGEPSKSGSYRLDIEQEDPAPPPHVPQDENISFSDNQADELNTPSQRKSFDTEPTQRLLFHSLTRWTSVACWHS